MFKLHKSSTSRSSLEIEIYLKPGTYQYKYNYLLFNRFKVDGKWEIASGYPVVGKGETINNSIIVDEY